MTRIAKTFNLINRMAICQVIGDSSKNRVVPKDDTGEAYPNVGMTSFKIKSCMPTGRRAEIAD